MPEGFTIPSCRIDARTSGATHFASRWPKEFDMPDTWMKGIFREVSRPERLVVLQYFSNEAGKFVKPQGMADGFPETMLMRVTFEDLGGKTKMTVEQSYPMAVAQKQQAVEGWNSSLDKLAAYLRLFRKS